MSGENKIEPPSKIMAVNVGGEGSALLKFLKDDRKLTPLEAVVVVRACLAVLIDICGAVTIEDLPTPSEGN